MGCPDEHELELFLDRRLNASRARALEDHFGLCEACRELVFLLADLDPEKI